MRIYFLFLPSSFALWKIKTTTLKISRFTDREIKWRSTKRKLEKKKLCSPNNRGSRVALVHGSLGYLRLSLLSMKRTRSFSRSIDFSASLLIPRRFNTNETWNLSLNANHRSKKHSSQLVAILRWFHPETRDNDQPVEIDTISKTKSTMIGESAQRTNQKKKWRKRYKSRPIDGIEITR